MVSRPAVPAELKRRLLQEAGFRCAVPTCRTIDPLDIEHIDGWAKVKEHKFENMIVLCANCHARVTRGKIPKSAIRNYKANLAVTNGRYSLFEMRLLEFFYVGYEAMTENKTYITPVSISRKISEDSCLHVKGLVDDGYLKLSSMLDVNNEIDAEVLKGHSEINGPLFVLLTQKGVDFMYKLFDGESIIEMQK